MSYVLLMMITQLYDNCSIGRGNGHTLNPDKRVKQVHVQARQIVVNLPFLSTSCGLTVSLLLMTFDLHGETANE